MIDYEDRRYLYHVGVAGYDELCPLGLLPNRDIPVDIKNYYGKNEKRFYRYTHTINGFLAPVSKQNVLDLRESGFSRWGDGELWLYKIDLFSSSNILKIKDLSITSTSEQCEYDNIHFPKIKNIKDDQEFLIAKSRYIKKRRKYLDKVYTRDNMSISEYLKIPNKYIKDWKDLDKHIKSNIEIGSKEQYATCIPHVQVLVSSCLDVDDAYRLV